MSRAASIGAAAMLLLAGAWGLLPALQGIHVSWSSVYGHFAHGYLVLVMALWLAWRAWRDRPALQFQPFWPAAVALAAVIVLLIASSAMAVESLVESLVPLIVLAAIATVFGLQLARLLLWPILFLYFALPIWWVLNTPLQQLTTAVVNRWTAWSGVPAFIDGNFFHLPSGTIEIASLCSGLNFLVSAFALAAFQALVYLQRWNNRTRLMAAAAAMALVSNWVRIYSLILIGHFSDMQHYLIKVEHVYYGWVLFLVCMWPVFAYGARLEARERGVVSDRRDGGGIAAWPVARLLPAAVVASVLLVSPALLDLAVLRAGAPQPGTLVRLPGEPAPASATVVHQIALDGVQEQREAHRVDGRVVEYYQAWLPRLGREHELPDGFELVAGRWRPAGPVEHAADAVPYARQVGTWNGRSVLLATGSQVGGHSASGSIQTKLAALRGLLSLRRDGLLWLAAMPCRSDCEEEKPLLHQIIGSGVSARP